MKKILVWSIILVLATGCIATSNKKSGSFNAVGGNTDKIEKKYYPSGKLKAETIKGHACYHYSDNESINAARDIALSMAKREALESYSVFVESSSIVENHVLKNDLIATLTAAVLKNLKVTGKSEDSKNRKVCRTIQAKIEPLDVKSRIETKIKAYKRKKSNFPSGLPETMFYKVLKVNTINNKLVLTIWCKRESYPKAMITWYDKDGIPEYTGDDIAVCGRSGEVKKMKLLIPKPPMTYDWKLLR